MKKHLISYLLKKILPNSFISIVRKLKKNSFENKQIQILDNINSKFTNTIYIDQPNILSELCEKYGSDKGFVNPYLKKPYNWMPLSYSTYYHSIFNLCRDKIKYIFECGLGTNNPNLASNMTKAGKPGASLRVWKDYFSNANIYGGDIDKDILFNNEDRITTYYLDQLDTASIHSMWQEIKINEFDIIIDDGLHTPDANLNFFFNSFDKLRKNGIFIIEDVKNKKLEYMKNRLKGYDFEIIRIANIYKKAYPSSLIVIRNT